MGVKRATSHPRAIAQRTPVPLETSSLKTARFSEVVRTCGQPQIFDLWSAPDQNKDFMGAVRQNRVMTIKRQASMSRKDFGFVGFLRDRNVSYLVFPEPLNAFSDRRIIGINYEQLLESGAAGSIVSARPSQRASPPFRVVADVARPPVDGTEIPQARRPAQKKFRVTFEFTARVRTSVEVDADSARQAQEMAAAQVPAPDLNAATTTRKVVLTRPL